MSNGLTMQAKEYLNCLLEIEKNMSNNYSVAMNEASNDDLYEEFFDMFTSIKDMTRDIYDLMMHLGWYNTEYVDEGKVTKKLDELTNKLNNLESE